MPNTKTCPMCTQAMAFNESLNNQLSVSLVITKKRDTDMNFLNVFVSTKGNAEQIPENVGGAAFAIEYCPWCGRKLNPNKTEE